MGGNRTISLFLLLALVLPVIIYAFVKSYENSHERLPVFGNESNTIINYRLTDQDGNTATPADWAGKIVVANFFFTRCPSICPKITRQLNRVQQAFEGKKNIIITSFTVDPDNDTPARLKRYAALIDVKTSGRQFVTGNKMEIYRLARNTFMVTATDGDGGPGDFIHSDKLVLLDMQKRIRGYYNGTVATEVTQMINDIKRLENE